MGTSKCTHSILKLAMDTPTITMLTITSMHKISTCAVKHRQVLLHKREEGTTRPMYWNVMNFIPIVFPSMTLKTRLEKRYDPSLYDTTTCRRCVCMVAMIIYA